VLFSCQASDISVTLDDVSSPSLALVVGANCKRIRVDKIRVTQDELARCARLLGLRWNAAKVGDFEAGRSAPTFATVLAVTLALQMALEDAAERRQESPEGGVTLADLVDGRGHIALTDSVSVAAAQLAEVCRGRTFTPFDLQYWRRLRSVQETIDATVAEIRQRSGLTEHRLAKNLGITADRLADVSFQLWHSTFSDERDQRAGPDANQQKRGRISRELRAELEKALSDGND
jgi:transcriptional regulator with XRE-family HTH domain